MRIDLRVQGGMANCDRGNATDWEWGPMADMPYRIGRLLGRGGMSEVYEAEATDGRRLAVKVFRDEKQSRFLRNRFMAEARLLKTLYHPNIVRVHDCGIDGESGRAWFAMDLVLDADGKARTLENARKEGGIGDAQLRTWFAETKSALDYLHRCGVVHRDVKLENILIDRDGHARLADFGVSRIIDGKLKAEVGVESTFVTGETTGTRPVMGTYFYLPPEIRAGAPATAATDGYALGVAFFRLLTGMWYEPGTNALDLLAPFPGFWRNELPKLLNVADRAASTKPPQVGSRVPRDRRRIWRISLVAATVALIVVGIAFTVGRRVLTPPSHSFSLPPSFATPLVKSLDLGNGVEMDFCACPAGTFMMSNLDKSTCHKVTITRPFWIAATPVTARQLRLGFPNAERDELAKAMETTFTNMIVACKMQGGMVREYIQRLNMKYGQTLPDGYVFRLPTEAELEYAIREGGERMPDDLDVYRDNRETNRLLESVGLPPRNDLRLLPHSPFPVPHSFGLATLWTDTEQAVLDTVDGRVGTKTAATAISYAPEEIDPLRTGALNLSRQFQFQRWLLMKEPSGFIRICIGPQLAPSH
ncbi:MAG: protein kinase [Kiritimatiellae bacterium]|nr:protein kinase [Kiritimatiellia bacterium]